MDGKEMMIPDSDELKAIKKVQQTLNIAQHRVLKSVDTLRATTQILQQSSAYSDAVAIPLGVFDDKISILLQNEVNLVETFRHICNPLNSRSPIYTLQFFKKRFMDDCQGLNSPEAIEETAQIYVEVLKYFHHFEKHFNSTKAFNRQEQDRYSRVKSDTMSSVAKMSKENATLYLKSFKKATKTRDFKTKGHSHRINVLEAIIPEAPGNTCYMYNAVLGYAYSHQPVLAELKSMTYDLVDTHFTASFCASFLNDGNPELIKANLEQIQNHTYRILKFSKNFTLNVLDSAWNKNLFQETITDTLIDYDFVDQNYQAATVKTEKALNLIGNPQWSYQVMIYKADPYGWAMRCKNIWLCFKVEINQFASAYVFRHPKGSTDRAQSAGEWLNDDKKTKLCKAIKNQVGEEPQTIINAMEKYLEEDVTNRYHGFSLIQERYPDPKQAEINAQVSPDRGKRNKKFQSKFECQKQHFWHLYKIQCIFYL
uniref:Uncharacterized protein n=1 Tax=Panagrolaimus davidi TaxID=227884 RepID=A0A914PXP3_9BILA